MLVAWQHGGTSKVTSLTIAQRKCASITGQYPSSPREYKDRWQRIRDKCLWQQLANHRRSGSTNKQNLVFQIITISPPPAPSVPLNPLCWVHLKPSAAHSRSSCSFMLPLPLHSYGPHVQAEFSEFCHCFSSIFANNISHQLLQLQNGAIYWFLR